MGHSISALIVKGGIQEEAVKDWDLIIEQLPFEIKLVYLDHYYTACWQKLKHLEGYLPNTQKAFGLFPTEIVTLEIAKELTGRDVPVFAVILTDYFSGVGEQFAQIYQGKKILDTEVNSINQALKALGVKALGKMDEFDTIGLGRFRHNPEYLEKYSDMDDELGV